LQDCFGHANDVRVAYDLMHQFGDTKDHDARAIDRAGGLVLGWHERDLAIVSPSRKLVRRFKQMDRFW
jgi:triphosphatase